MRALRSESTFRLMMLLCLMGAAALAGCAVRGRGSRAGWPTADDGRRDRRRHGGGRPVPKALERIRCRSRGRAGRGPGPGLRSLGALQRADVRLQLRTRSAGREAGGANGWSKVAPEPVRKSIGNVFQNLGMPRRFVNNLLQLKIDGAVRELAGFVMNSTLGVGGLLDIARIEGVTPPDEEDTGQTLAVYGVKPGPYLVLPLFPPSTVRDTIGSTIDGLLDPLSLVMPLVGSVAKRVGTTVNDRSMNLELYEEVEESILDLYSGTRNLYLQRRERAIRE